LKFVRIFRLCFVIVPIFFSENLSKTLTNKTKKELAIAIVRILSYGLSSYKKALSVSPNYFNLVFPDFSPNLQDFFSIENIQLSYFHPGAYRTKKKKELIKYVVPVVTYDRECIQKL
jgi:hypothetical protein